MKENDLSMEPTAKAGNEALPTGSDIDDFGGQLDERLKKVIRVETLRFTAACAVLLAIANAIDRLLT